MPRWILAVVAAAALAPAPARAQSLSTRFGATTGYRMMLGDLGKRYQHGWSIGMEAGAQVGWLGILLSLQRSVIYSAESDNFDNSVFFLEASATLRPRIRLRGEQTALYVQASLDLLRASFPIEPDQTQSYFGPSVGFGGEFGLGPVTLGMSVKYGLLVGGPQGVQFLISAVTGLK